MQPIAAVSILEEKYIGGDGWSWARMGAEGDRNAFGALNR
jgi:hypothetical protein